MRIQRIDMDTSVIGGCHDPEVAPWLNGLMQDFRDGTYRPVISEVVATEIEGDPTIVQETFAELLALNSEIVEVSGEALALADAYQRRGILPVRSSADALHIALATMAEVDVLVSWHFRHVVHFDKARLFNGVNLELGFKLLQIYSPREVTSSEAENAAEDDGDDSSDSRQSSIIINGVQPTGGQRAARQPSTTLPVGGGSAPAAEAWALATGILGRGGGRCGPKLAAAAPTN